MRRVIINADDFGLSPGVNRGIIKAYREGILTSTTLMANMGSFGEAVRLSKENPGLGVGVHLNLLRGPPISPRGKVPSLLTKGYFHGSASTLLKNLFTNRINLLEVETEWRAQIERVMDSGIAVTHFDSEKHLHCLPPLFRVAIKLAVEFNISWVRFIEEPFPAFWLREIAKPQFIKLCFLNCCCKKILREFNGASLRRTDSFYGVFSSGKMVSEEYGRIFSKIRPGITEIMCHPGFIDDFDKGESSLGSYYINDLRRVELDGLLAPDLKEIAREKEIDFTGFGDIK